MRRVQPGSGLEGAPDIMLLTMAGLMVAIVWLEGERVAGGIDGLEQLLSETSAGSVTLRADSSTRWEDGLRAMSIAARLGLPISVAADR